MHEHMYYYLFSEQEIELNMACFNVVWMGTLYPCQ
jgi:hypothetical protein